MDDGVMREINDTEQSTIKLKVTCRLHRTVTCTAFVPYPYRSSTVLYQAGDATWIQRLSYGRDTVPVT